MMALTGERARKLIKALIEDTAAEPAVRWTVKRSRGIRMPYDLVKNEIYDRQAAAAMERVLGSRSNCIDIGSHNGEFLKVFLRLAPEGRHFAFEPIPQLAQTLKANFPSVEVLDIALADRPGEATFYVLPDAPALSGLSRRDFVRPHEARKEIKVRTESLDAAIPRNVPIALIKLDVEGAEGLVLSGAIDTIRRCRPYIVFEHGRRSSQAFGYAPEAIYEMLVDRCALRISLLPEWLARGRALTKREFVRSAEWYFLAHPD